jgi:hypothetical protein
MPIKILLTIIILLIPVYSWGADCSWTDNAATVASPYDHVDVQNCVNEASLKTGEVTISIPTATVNWDDRVTVNMASGWANVTKLTIQGAGAGQTNITDTGTNTTFMQARLFQLITKSGIELRLSGMTLTCGTTTGPDATSGLIVVSGSSASIRIDNITVPNLNKAANSKYYNAIMWQQNDSAYGVIDSCSFTSTGAAWNGQAIKIFGANSGYGEANSWIAKAFTPGSANALYVENNTFNYADGGGNGCSDTYHGDRSVYRYNNTVNCGFGGHGNDSSSAGSSTHTQEIYNNAFTGSGTNYVVMRGGTGVVYNNSFANTIGTPIIVTNYRGNYYYEGTATNVSPSSTVMTDSTASFSLSGTRYIYNQTQKAYCLITSSNSTSATCSAGLSGGKTWSSGDKYIITFYGTTDLMCDGNSTVDGNVEANEGWLCKQQAGSTYASGYTYKPIYAWGNVHDGQTKGWAVVNPADSTRSKTYHVVEDKTFFNCDSAATCKTATDAVDVPGFGENKGWTYEPYDCPHTLVGTGTCLSSTAGKSGYSTGSAAPTLTSATIGTNGTTLTLVFSEAVNATAITGLSISVPSGQATISLTSGSGTTSLVTTISRTVTQGVTGILLSYTQPGNEIEATDDQADLASFSNSMVVNNSTQSNTIRTVTPSAGTGCNIAPPTAQSIVNGLTTQFTYSADVNYQFSAWGGTCGGSGTATYTTDAITADCTVTISCTKISPDVTIGSGAAVTLGSGAVGTLY